ncbi:MAG TPA: 23S rRNA (pseudouridine(1915)-N(3))-methyltransferase RlmH [candidate division Zixibacteria bacterium]|nr:23S rRNA (pseudouridine(1915)-N(3))-methyltransferase RlmH [candidate division Zixibacteria bacterium]
MGPKILLLLAGRAKEKWIEEGFRHYRKLLSGFAQVEVKEFGKSPRELEQLTTKIPKGCFTVLLDVQGERFSSEVLAEFFRTKMNQGTSRFCFLIGGSEGLPDEVKAKANLRWSFSPLTFPHHLIRVVLVEQLYRAFSILGGRKYHK